MIMWSREDRVFPRKDAVLGLGPRASPGLPGSSQRAERLLYSWAGRRQKGHTFRPPVVVCVRSVRRGGRFPVTTDRPRSETTRARRGLSVSEEIQPEGARPGPLLRMALKTAKVTLTNRSLDRRVCCRRARGSLYTRFSYAFDMGISG